METLKKPKLEDFNITENDIKLYSKYEEENNNLALKYSFFILLIIVITLAINYGLGVTIAISLFIAPIVFFIMYGFLINIVSLRDPILKEKGEKYQKFKEADSKYEIEFSKTLETFWYKLNGYQFEIEVANLYKKLGYKVQRTGGSGDGGIDLVLTDSMGIITIVQCKAHKNPVAPAVVRDLYGAMINKKANKAILVSLSGCTSGVYSFIRGKNISIVTINDLINMQKNNL